MRYVLPLLLCLAFGASGLAADPPAPAPMPTPSPSPAPSPAPVPAPAPALNPHIIGPGKVEPYTIVRLTVVGLDSKAGSKWTVRDAATGKTVGVSYGQNGQRGLRSVEFVAPPGVYEVTCSYVTKGPGAEDPFTLDDLTSTVTIGTPPAPGPGPVPPGPTPNPPTPGTGAFVIIISDEVAPTSAQQNVILGPTVESLRTAGKLRVYGNVSDSDKIKAKSYDRMLTDTKLAAPALFVLDKSGKVVLAAKLPTDDPSTAALLKGVMAP